MTKKNKKKKLNLFWLKIVGLAVFGLGLLARNVVIILTAVLLFGIWWTMNRRLVSDDKEIEKLSDVNDGGAMKIVICKNYNKMSRKAARIVIEQL
ncbi:MAG: hypothetical protein ACTSUT_05470, partial [Promethearchaeota archaeon]